MKKRTFYLTAAVALTCTSCGNGLYSVSGKVTYKGQPAAGAAVFFQRQGADLMNEPMIMGLVQQDGSFSVVCGDKGAVVPPGKYDVLVEWRPSSNQPKGLAQHAARQARRTLRRPKEPPIARGNQGRNQ